MGKELSPVEKTSFLVHWCLDVGIQGHAMAVKALNVPQNARAGLLNKVQIFRDCQQQVRDILGLPVPFQYFHLLNMMIVINMLLWAYGMGCADSPLYTLVFVFAELIFMGMMELASAFADPFGTDEVDFPAGSWLTEWLSLSVTLLEYETPGQADNWKAIIDTERPLSKELIGVHIFTDCGFADTPAGSSPAQNDGSLGKSFWDSTKASSLSMMFGSQQTDSRLLSNNEVEEDYSSSSDEESNQRAGGSSRPTHTADWGRRC